MKPVFGAAIIGILALAQSHALEIQPAAEITFTAEPNQTYQLVSSPDLADWQPVGLPIAASEGPRKLTFPATEAGRYFRLDASPVQNLNSLLEPIRAANRLPGLACAVVLSNRIVGLGAVGLRKTGVPDGPVTLQDKWHHGSLTKSLTASLAAIMVASGEIKWETTLAEVFPDFASRMNPAWRTVTLDWLCSNRSGAPGDLSPNGIWNALQTFTGTPRKGRQLLLERLTILPPNAPPGTQYEYSNAGFALAGHMLETRAGKPWEQLLTEKLFHPLGMDSAGFGVPATPRMTDHPWGHQLPNNVVTAIEPGPAADNPPAIGPAGTVHASIVDMARYLLFHIAGERSAQLGVPPESFRKLHAAIPNNANYGYGWSSVDRPWATPGKAVTHNGSNTQWFSVIWLAPGRQFGVIATCNIASPTGANPGPTGTDQAVAKMIQTFLNR